MITPAAPTAPAFPAARPADAAPAPAPPSAPAAETAAKPQPEAAPAPAPLSLDVTRSAGGVFVYTLSDPATGTVVAVIPREAVQAGRDGRNLDRRV